MDVQPMLRQLTYALAALTLASLLAPAHGQARPAELTPMPASAWELLESAAGVTMHAERGERVNIQVIFDPHCPACAKLYQQLADPRYAQFPIRWVPVAYFPPDSELVSAAILGSPDPESSLEKNFSNYDYDNKRGGYHASGDGELSLSSAHARLYQQWLHSWGGFTPMIILRRSGDGQIVQSTYVPYRLGNILGQAGDARPAQLQSWQEPD